MKLFITSKVNDTEKQTIAEIEKAVQEDLDAYVEKNKVIFKLYIAGKNSWPCISIVELIINLIHGYDYGC